MQNWSAGKKLKICIFGNKTTTSSLVKHLVHAFDDEFTLVTLDPEQADTSQISGLDPALSKLEHLGLKLKLIDNYSLNGKAIFDFFQAEGFDLGICTGWQRLIPSNILKTFRLGIFGWHGSGFEFPNGRGRSPLNWSIRLGLSRVFHNCFRYNSGIDDGDVFDTCIININDDDYISDVQKKALEHILISGCKLITSIKAQNLVLYPQPSYPAVMFPKLNDSSGQLHLDLMSKTSVMNIIRASSHPFPGAFVIKDQLKIRIWKATFAEFFVKEKLHRIYSNVVLESDSVLLICRDGALMSNHFTIEEIEGEVDQVE